jgi:hypothetical protein
MTIIVANKHYRKKFLFGRGSPHECETMTADKSVVDIKCFFMRQCVFAAGNLPESSTAGPAGGADCGALVLMLLISSIPDTRCSQREVDITIYTF